MKDLRALLIDCRIELRRLVRDFHKTPLCERLDAATQALANAPVDAVPADPAAPGQRQVRETSNQVALAWQLMARYFRLITVPIAMSMAQRLRRACCSRIA